MLLGARYYASAVGRFVTVDPVREGGNWYGYSGNNPICLIDPSGFAAEPAPLAPSVPSPAVTPAQGCILVCGAIACVEICGYAATGQPVGPFTGIGQGIANRIDPDPQVAPEPANQRKEPCSYYESKSWFTTLNKAQNAVAPGVILRRAKVEPALNCPGTHYTYRDRRGRVMTCLCCECLPSGQRCWCHWRGRPR